MTPFFKEGDASFYLGNSLDMLGKIVIPEDAGWLIDPPWDKGIVIPAGQHKLILCDGWRQRDIFTYYGAPIWIFTWDCISSWYTPNRPLRRAKYCFWYGNISDYIFGGYCEPRYKKEKPRLVGNTRGKYLFTPNPRGKNLSDVYRSPITKLHKKGASHKKPIPWLSMLIANCLGRRPVIIDPFMGTGSAALACRELKIPYIGIEVCREQIDAAIKNYTTGQMVLW